MNAAVKAKALKTLDGMEQIVRNEMMVPGKYVGYVIERPDLAKAGAVCGGREYCLIGSAWIAHGDAEITKFAAGGVRLEGTGTKQERDEYLGSRPALRAVYDALNEVAVSRVARLAAWDRSIVKEGFDDPEDPPFGGSLAESLFENTCPGRRKLLNLVASARREIEKA